MSNERKYISYNMQDKAGHQTIAQLSGAKPTKLASSVLSIVACNATAPRVYILVHFIVQAMIAQHILFSPSSDQPASGGYDYKFLSAIPSKYACSICIKVLRDAHLTACCGQHFCASCLTHWLGTQQGRKTCPHCQQENFQHIPNKERIRDVNELKIWCTNHREGCRWLGKLGRLKSHLDSDKGCGYVEVTCTNKGCRERVSRKDLQIHSQKKCYYRPYECEYCGHKDTYTAITGDDQYSSSDDNVSSSEDDIQCHYEKCLEYPLACPRRCGVTGIRRRAMPDHHSSCLLEPLNCPFKDAGCTEKIARKDMENHMTANQQKHMLLTFQLVQRSNERYHELKHGQQLISKEIDSLEESIRCNTNTPESTAQSLSRMKSILQASLDKIGDALTFRVTDFPQLREEKKAWHSPPFSIADKVRVHLAVYPSGVGRRQGSHVSVSLILTEVVKKEEHTWLEHNVSVAAIGQERSAMHKTLELCTSSYMYGGYLCSANFPFPSPGEVLQSDELFLKIEEANSLLVNNAMILELKLLEHRCHR